MKKSRVVGIVVGVGISSFFPLTSSIIKLFLLTSIMFTLIYFQGKFNRPDTLFPFLENNVGKDPIMQIDFPTPYQGNEQDLIKELCEYLNGINLKLS